MTEKHSRFIDDDPDGLVVIRAADTSDDDPIEWSHPMPEDALVRLASITHVEGYRRRGTAGNSEKVRSYLRKVLDDYNGTNPDTKRGAYHDLTTARYNAQGIPVRKHTVDVTRPLADPIPDPGAAGVQTFEANVKAALQRQAQIRDRWGSWFNATFKSTGNKAEFLDAVVKKASADTSVDWMKPDSVPGDPLDLLGLDPEVKRHLKALRSIFVGTVEFSVSADQAELLRNLSADDLLITLAVAQRLAVRDTMIALAAVGTLDYSPKKNWVEKAGGLPKFIEDMALHMIQDSGLTREHAIAASVQRTKVLAAKGNARAVAALAQWEKMKASTKVKKADG